MSIHQQSHRHNRSNSQHSNIGLDTEQQFELDLANIIKGIAFQEISIENLKIKSAEDPHFDIFMAWECLDISKKGIVNKEQLTCFLGKNTIPCSEHEAIYLINMITKGKVEVEEQEFIEWFLPYTNYNLKVLAIKRRENNLYLRKIHNMDNQVTKQVSEQSAAKILGSEIHFYRDIDKLKQQFVKDHSYNIHDIFKCISFNQNGLVDYERLKQFMKKLNITFNIEECQGFFYRCCAVDTQKKEISYEEMVQSILPNEPIQFKAYQNTFDKDNLHQYVIKKADSFKFDVQPMSFGKKPPKEQKNMMQHYYPFRNCFDPFSTGKISFNRDQGYMAELTQYGQTYFNPSKDHSVIIRNSNKNQSAVRTHDHFYDRYYALLYDREKSEILYNKFGKRYVFDQKISDFRTDLKQSTVQTRIRSQSYYNPNSNNTQKQSQYDPTDRINPVQNAYDNSAYNRTTQHFNSQESSNPAKDTTPTMRLGQKFLDDF